MTRAAGKIIFKTATKCTGKYMNSPFYKGTLFWNDISAVEQYLESVLQFANVLDKLYVLYMRRSLHKMVHFANFKIGVVYFESCVSFDTL